MFLWMCCEVWLLSGYRRKFISQGSVWLSLLCQVIKDAGFGHNVFLSLSCFHWMLCSLCHSAISLSLVWGAAPSGEPNAQLLLFHVVLWLFSAKHRGKHCKEEQGFGEIFCCWLKAIEDCSGKSWIVVARGWGRFQEAENLIKTFNMHKILGSGLRFKVSVAEQLAYI